MRNVASGILIILTATTVLSAQNPFAGLEFGMPQKNLPAAARDISNKQSWDETEFEVTAPPYTLFRQFRPQKCRLTFYKGRLYAAACDFARSEFGILYANFVGERKVPANRDLQNRDKSATWYGEFKDNTFSYILRVYQLSGVTEVAFSDEMQKNFRFTDLFKGSLPWIILSIAGLFAAYLAFGWFATSKCPKCGQRKLTVTGKSYANPEDFNREIFGTQDIRWDEVYHFRCKNCGFEKDDRYSKWRFGRE